MKLKLSMQESIQTQQIIIQQMTKSDLQYNF